MLRFRLPLRAQDAAWSGNLGLAKLLLDEFGVDPNLTTTSCHDTALGSAACRSELPVLQLLLERGADPNRARTDGYTPLFYAAEVGASAGSTAVMAALLGAGADPNARASGGVTPLHWAARHGRVWAIEALVLSGATGSEDDRGWTPVDVALRDGIDQYEYEDGSTAPAWAPFAAVQVLVSSGAAGLSWPPSDLPLQHPTNVQLVAWLRRVGVLDAVLSNNPGLAWGPLLLSVDAGLGTIARHVLGTGRDTPGFAAPTTPHTAAAAVYGYNRHLSPAAAELPVHTPHHDDEDDGEDAHLDDDDDLDDGAGDEAMDGGSDLRMRAFCVNEFQLHPARDWVATVKVRRMISHWTWGPVYKQPTN